MQSFKTWLRTTQRQQKNKANALKIARAKVGRKFRFSKITDQTTRRLLRALAKSGKISVEDLSSKIGVGRTKTRALLQQLYDQKLVQFDDEGNVSITPKALQRMPGKKPEEGEEGTPQEEPEEEPEEEEEEEEEEEK